VSKNRIFISYSRLGNGPTWKAALLRALHVFERHHLLDVWQDGRIRVSSFWDDEIKQAISNARLAVVLLTQEALDSEYIRDVEFPLLREQQQRSNLKVFPIICEKCDWQVHDWLRTLQAPNESNPISQLSVTEQKNLIRKLATDIAEELTHLALADLLSRLPAGAEITGMSGESEPESYLVKFPLRRAANVHEEKLIGREQELALLSLAFAQPNTAIVSLVAWGGVGKTILVQHWLELLEREGWFGARRVYAWSFYSQGTKDDRQASEDTFLAHALEWFGVQCEPTLPQWDKGRLLADAVARERTLLILDGIEPLQYPPGPMDGQLRSPGVQTLLKRLARKANETEHRSLCLVTTREPLTDLADFQRRPDAAWGSVLRVDLGNLTEEAGAALLHHAGAKRAGAAEIEADDAELLAASREVDGHALTLNLLSRFLARSHKGDIRRRDLVKFEEADRKEQGGTTFKMLSAFENWFARSGEFGARQLALLRVLGLFDRPAEAECLSCLRKPPPISHLTEAFFNAEIRLLRWKAGFSPISDENWNHLVSFLQDCALVTMPDTATQARNKGAIDCHPLIREYFEREVQEQNPTGWRLAHRRLYEHLTETTDYRPDTLEGLQPLYQAVAHGCHAGMYQDCCDKVYVDRILRGQELHSMTKFGAWHTDLAAVTCFFAEPFSQVQPSLKKGDRAWLLETVAFQLRALGRLIEALEPMRTGRDMLVKQRYLDHAAAACSTLSELELTLGEVTGAVGEAAQSMRIAAMTRDGFIQRAALGRLADALHQQGNRPEALVRFQQAELVQRKYDPKHHFLYSVAGFRYCALLLSAGERAAWNIQLTGSGLPIHQTKNEANQKDLSPLRSPQFALQFCREVDQRAAQALKWEEGVRGAPLVDFALHHLALGRSALYQVIIETFERHNPPFGFEQARQHVITAVDGLRRAGTAHHIPRGLLSRAWVRFCEMDAGDAHADLDEAWDIAERGPMRLHLADIHLYRARLFFREKSYPWKSPRDDLAAAEKLINDCGYHRRDGELADAKRAILGEY
jgi:TIR domain